jgi:hypothetical protein
MEASLDHGKPSISCFDEILQKRRLLTPDAMGHIKSNGHKFCIELDGEQHFRPVPYYGGPSKFRVRICSDIAKNNFAAENGISLLRVAYTEEKQVEKYIREFLDYCASTAVPQAFFSDPELYRKTELIVRESQTY